MCLQYLPQHQSQHVMWSLVQRTYSFIYEFEMGLLVRSGKLSYELHSQRFNIYCVPSDILIIWWLDFSEACSIKNKAWGKWTGNLEGITWEKRSATSKARWDPGAVTPTLCVPMLQQGPSWEQNLEEGNYWQLFLILLYLPDNGVKTSHWWSILSHVIICHQWQLERLLRERLQAWGLFAALRPVSANLLHLRVRGHISTFTISLWTLFTVSVSKPSVNLMMLSAATTSYGNNLQKLITSCVKTKSTLIREVHLKFSSFKFPVILGSFWISLAPNKKAETQTKATRMPQMTFLALSTQSLHFCGSLLESQGLSSLKSKCGTHCTKLIT